MFHKIIDVKPLSDLRLFTRFQDGNAKIYSIKQIQSKWPGFVALSEIPGLFECVHIDSGGYGVVWNDELDLAAEEIWNHGQTSEQIESIDTAYKQERS